MSSSGLLILTSLAGCRSFFVSDMLLQLLKQNQCPEFTSHFPLKFHFAEALSNVCFERWKNPMIKGVTSDFHLNCLHLLLIFPLFISHFLSSGFTAVPFCPSVLFFTSVVSFSTNLIASYINFLLFFLLSSFCCWLLTDTLITSFIYSCVCVWRMV